ncbi:MAG TPA: hypothetical protein VI452_16805 [Marmoricola sp.]
MTRAAALLVPLLLLTGCGAASSAAGHPADTALQQPPAHRVRVGLTEWQVDLAPTRALPGRITLVVTNAGATEHNLVVTAGAQQWSLPSIAPGRRSRLVVRAGRGTSLQLSSQMAGQLRPMKATLPVGR